MKKLFVMLTMVGCVLLLTGCFGDKETQNLECVYTNANVKVNYGIAYEGKKVVKMHVNYDVDYSGFDATLVEDKKKEDLNTITEAVSEYPIKDKSNKFENNHLYANFELDPEKIAESGEQFETIDEAKVGLEGVGYTCTIE